jgi:hypothetical protein
VAGEIDQWGIDLEQDEGRRCDRAATDCTAPIDDDDAHTRFRQRSSRECARNAGPNDDDVGLD